jgi:flagellar biogenesis protein FliO
MDPQATELPGLGGSLAVTFLSLGLVCLLAYFALKWVYRRGVGQSNGPIRVVARCSPEHKRSVFLIEAAGRCFLVGASDGGMNLLAEVDPQKVHQQVEAQQYAAGRLGRAVRGQFTDILNRVLSRSNRAPQGDTEPETEPEPPPTRAPIDQPSEQKG